MKELTKEELIELGVTDVTEDGVVYYRGKIKEPNIVTSKHKYGKDKSYPVISFIDKRVKKTMTFPYKKKDGTITRHKGWIYGVRSVTVSRVVYAWYNGIVPANMDVDHLDNNVFNNNINNLQLLTRRENLAKRFIDDPNNCMNQYDWLKRHK